MEGEQKGALAREGERGRGQEGGGERKKEGEEGRVDKAVVD